MKRLGFHTLRDKATDTLGDKLSRQLQEDLSLIHISEPTRRS